MFRKLATELLTGLLKGHRKTSHVIRVVLQPTYDSLYKSNAVPYPFQLNPVYVYIYIYIIYIDYQMNYYEV